MNEQITKQVHSLVTTTVLPQEASEVIKAGVVEKLKEVNKLRQFGFVDKTMMGAELYIWFYADEMTGASDVGQGSSFNYESAAASKGSADFEKLGKGFEITWEADNLEKLPIRLAQSKQAAELVFNREDTKICTALIADSGNTFTGTDWSANTADPVADFAQAKRLCRLDGYEIDLVILNPTNFEELESVIASNFWFNKTSQAVEGDTKSFKGIQIVNSNQATLGTAIFIKKGSSGAFNVGVGKDLTVHIFDDDDRQTTKVQVFERIAIGVLRTDAVCTATSL